MNERDQSFQVFIKPVGPACNLDCSYCYYLDTEALYPEKGKFRMSDRILEEYIKQHIDVAADPYIFFSWHGGEPTLAGIPFFERIIEYQKKYQPASRQIINGIQTNGTLLNKEWCEFFAENNFTVGISIDGPAEFHDHSRFNKARKSSFNKTLDGYNLLKQYNVLTEILCVVNSVNVQDPMKVYRFFKELEARYITFLPYVKEQEKAPGKATKESVPTVSFGDFLIAIFDEWLTHDIGNIKIQIIEEALRTAFKQEHTLCIFKETCGRVPVVEHNGDFYTCDHYVNKENYVGNISKSSLSELLDSPKQQAFGEDKLKSLPGYCLNCEVRDMCNGGCPKNRFIKTPDGDPGLNFLCAGYKKFFNHCRPFVMQVANVWSQQNNSQ
jgi:uncharacterized protein